MQDRINIKSNKIRLIIHGFFFAGAMAIAEPSTIMPLIVDYFTDNKVLVGFFTSLLKGGSIIMQLYAAFHVQSYLRIMKPLISVLIVRFFSWLLIGVLFYFMGTSLQTGNEQSKFITLILFGVLLFIFSFSAGFGSIYFQELLGKSFSNIVRGKMIAIRQFFAGLGAILGGFVTAYILSKYESPISFSIMFILSAFYMSIGYIALGTFVEFDKTRVQKRENRFTEFIKNSIIILRDDKTLRTHVLVMLISYGYLFALPFVILQAKYNVGLSGKSAGLLVSIQMTGAMLSNILWGKLASKMKNRLNISISYLLIITALLLSILATHIYYYYVIYFIIGATIDGFRLSFNNMILIIAPEEKRPTYVAIQNNIAFIGVLFAIPGGIIYNVYGFIPLAIIALSILSIGFIASFRMKKI